jgi:hypothetical protein
MFGARVNLFFKRTACAKKTSKGQSKKGHRQIRVEKEQLSARIVRQKRALLSLARIEASGLTDFSRDHDTYLHAKP